MTRYRNIAIVCAVICLICIMAVIASAATFFWDASTGDAAGYRLYRAPGSGTWPAPTCGVFAPVQDFGLVTTGIESPPNGRWCYHLTAFDAAWPPNESGPSNRVYLQVPPDSTPPGVPSGAGLRVVTP